jgi:hypothetical protein
VDEQQKIVEKLKRKLSANKSAQIRHGNYVICNYVISDLIAQIIADAHFLTVFFPLCNLIWNIQLKID